METYIRPYSDLEIADALHWFGIDASSRDCDICEDGSVYYGLTKILEPRAHDRDAEFLVVKRPSPYAVETTYTVRTPAGIVDVVFGSSGAVTTRVRFAMCPGYSRLVDGATRAAKRAHDGDE